MFPEVLPMVIDEGPGVLRSGHLGGHKGSIVTLAHKADLLALLQFIDWEPEGFSLLPNVGFVQASDGEEQSGEPSRVETVQEIALVFPAVDGSMDLVSGEAVEDTDIVPRGNIPETTTRREFKQPAKLHPFVTADTGVRRGACGIAMKKVVDDATPKILPAVDHLIWNMQFLSDELGNADLTAAAFLPLLGGSHGGVFVFPDLKRDPSNVIPLTDKKGRRDRAIDSAAHAEQHGGTGHGKGYCTWRGLERARG
jgi:hypothetical protein